MIRYLFFILGIPSIEGKFPYGSHPEILKGAVHINTINIQNYQHFKDKDVYGTYVLGKPCLNVKNVESIRHILVKDFNSFVDRNDPNFNKMLDGGKTDQLWRMQMANLTGDDWKDVRSTFTPIFTSGKLKGMLSFIYLVGARLKAECEKLANEGKDFDLKDLYGKFSLDSLAECAFGINPRSFEGKDSLFVKHAARVFQNTVLDLLTVLRLIPGVQKISKILGVNLMNPAPTRFFVKILTDTIRRRKETGSKRNDLIDMMIDCLENEQVGNDSNEADNDQFHKDMELNHERSSKFKKNEDIIIATAMVILVAGYDTTGQTLSFLSYELAVNPDIQEKLQEEVDEAYKANNGALPDYRVIQELPYLEMCILETLRLHTPFGGLTRSCTKDTTIPNYEHPVRKNDLINIPVSGIHMDPEFYPNPTQFNPENFSKEARSSRSPYTFIGFGQGPRACIGMRFAMLEAKVAMLEVLSSYTFLPSDKNPKELELDPLSTLGYIKGGLHAKIVRR